MDTVPKSVYKVYYCTCVCLVVSETISRLMKHVSYTSVVNKIKIKQIREKFEIAQC